MAAIANIQAYNNAMRKSMFDKLFFVADTEDCHSYLDYGCADGTTLRMLSEVVPDAKLFGYDTNPNQISLAAKNIPQAFLTTAWDTLSIEMNFSETAVICSSLIHEIYAYGDEETIYDFWWDIRQSDFQYIVIRDMSVSSRASRKADAITVANVLGNADQKQLAEFESVYGSISDQKNLIHWLLKYRYTNNWERELHEDYLKLTHEGLLKEITTIPGYNMISYEHYVLPFLRRQVKSDFDVDIQDNTHTKIILARGNY